MPVAEPFRAPEHRYGPGNRGLKYDTEPGTPVRAAAAGEVTFAGPVAGALHVTVLHPDGLRTSYSFLERVEVRLGQRVAQGQVVGRSGDLLHLGARHGGAYLDPATLFSSAAVRVHLVPFDDPIAAGSRGERSALRQLVGGVARGVGHVAGSVAGSAAQGARLAGHLLSQTPAIDPVGFGLDMIRLAGDAHRDARRPCTAADVTPPPPDGRRVAILVAGLGSSSGSSSIDALDVGALGYAPSDVARFSYAGGRIPGRGTSSFDVPERPYERRHTHRDPRRVAVDLADLIESAVATADGAPVDVIGHSLGGLVARLALHELAERHGEAWLRSVGLLATLGSPHEGADLATMAEAVGRTTSGDLLLAGIDWLTDLDPRSDAVEQLSEVSATSRDLARRSVPGGIAALSIAASGDLVVPVPRTRLPGATSVVIRSGGLGAHDSLPGSAAAHREMALALAGAPPTCRGFGDALRDRASGRAIALGTDALTGVVTTGATVLDAFANPPGGRAPSPGDAGRIVPLLEARQGAEHAELEAWLGAERGADALVPG